ncbi:MAG TPA: GNAT family N-acetyltransferase [Candidatus Limnocylindria bacterium]|nr:GNAT family N-acetyltransferase [Candidatus Limnocylindria bacterium]
MRTDAGAVATAPPIDNLALRAYRPGDASAMVELWNRANAADGVPWRTDTAELEAWFSQSNDKFDPGRDLFLVELDGKLVATADSEWVDTTDGLREFRMGAIVDPAWRRRGIGSWLQGQLEAHAHRLWQTYPSDERRPMLGSWAMNSETAKIALLRRFGFEEARYFFDMVRPSLDEIDEPVLPEGLEFRPVREDQLKQMWDADMESFRDHWGGFDGSDESFQRWLHDPKFDRDLLVVAWDGDEIAGGVVNEINAVENAAFNRKRGWLQSVFVRRPWRRRGVGRAAVLRSLQALRERGMTSAGLGVDADNPTGALGLYTGTGFEVEHRSAAYRKPLEERA